MKFIWLKLAISIILTEGAGGIGSIFTTSALSSWYPSLVRSPISPPNWFFAPIWITLYFLMGVALFLVWNSEISVEKLRLPVALFLIQLVLNVLWSLIFFGFHSILFGAVEIVFLWFFILATIIEFRPVKSVSSYLLFPYLAWVTIATLLNISILWLNA